MTSSNITKLALCAFSLCASTLATNAAEVVASTSAPTAAPTPAQRPRSFVGVAVGGQLTDFSGGNTKGAFLYGASLQGGSYLDKDTAVLKNLLLTADVGMYLGNWTDTLFDVRQAYTGPSLPGWDFEHSRLSRKSEQMNIPAFLTLAYDFRPSKNFSLRVGPSVGITYVSMKSKFAGTDEIWSSSGTLIDRISDAESKSGSKVLFSYGMTLGASWIFAQHWSADLQYRFQGISNLNLGTDRNYGSAIAHQLNVGVSFRF